MIDGDVTPDLNETPEVIDGDATPDLNQPPELIQDDKSVDGDPEERISRDEDVDEFLDHVADNLGEPDDVDARAVRRGAGKRLPVQARRCKGGRTQCHSGHPRALLQDSRSMVTGSFRPGTDGSRTGGT